MSQPRILTVEDETVVAEDIRRQLVALGYEPVADTCTGEEAILLCGQLQPDLVLMDIRLAGEMDGIAAAQIIRERCSIPIIFLTALTDDSIINQAKLTEPFGYIIKPFDERALRTVIEMAIYKHRAERKLQESEERYRSIVENSGEGIGLVNAEERFVFANRVAEEIFGVGSGGLVGMNLEQFVSAEQHQLVQQETALRVHGKKSVYELEVLRPNGGKRNIIVTAVPRYDRERGFVGTYGIFRDITARKQAEAEKEKQEALNRQLQKSESLGRMAGAIAHHFNNQLQAVMLSLEMATSNLPRNAEPLEGLAEAMQFARKAAEVSTLMLTYLGQAQVKHEPLDLAEVCRRSLPLLRAAKPENVILETDLPSPGPGISANANQLQQVLTNLLTNAWEASGDRQGGIRLSVKTVSAADIPSARRFPIDCQTQEKAYACLEVADAGGGIAAKDLDKLFDPFFSTKFAGRGLGLSVVLGIARSHDGVVTVESEPGRGSVFRVFFPVSAEAVAALQKPVQVQVGPISESVRPEATVLVVEDESAVRKTLALILRRSGFSVFEAEDGVVAVEILRQHRDEIGCVVCDLTMPRMNGWETLTALRQLVPGLPVILASGYSEAQAMAGDHPERPQAFLHKPYEMKALMNAIKQVWANKQE